MTWRIQITSKLINDLLTYVPKNPLDAAVIALAIQDALRYEEQGFMDISSRIGKHIHAAVADVPWKEREAGTVKPVETLVVKF